CAYAILVCILPFGDLLLVLEDSTRLPSPQVAERVVFLITRIRATKWCTLIHFYQPVLNGREITGSIEAKLTEVGAVSDLHFHTAVLHVTNIQIGSGFDA